MEGMIIDDVALFGYFSRGRFFDGSLVVVVIAVVTADNTRLASFLVIALEAIGDVILIVLLLGPVD